MTCRDNGALPVEPKVAALRRRYEGMAGVTVDPDPFAQQQQPVTYAIAVDDAVEQYGRLLTAADDARQAKMVADDTLHKATHALRRAEARLEAATDVLHASANAHQKAAAGTPVSTVDTGSDQ